MVNVRGSKPQGKPSRSLAFSFEALEDRWLPSGTSILTILPAAPESSVPALVRSEDSRELRIVAPASSLQEVGRNFIGQALTSPIGTGWDLFGYPVPEAQRIMVDHQVLPSEFTHDPANGVLGMSADAFGSTGEIVDAGLPPQAGTVVIKGADFAAPALSLPWQVDDHALRATAALPREIETSGSLAAPRAPASTRVVPPSDPESLPARPAFQLRAADVVPPIVSPTPQLSNDSLSQRSVSDGIARPDDRGALSPLFNTQRGPDFAGAAQGSGEGAATSSPRAAVEAERSLPATPNPLSGWLRSNESSRSMPDDLVPPSPELAGVLGNIASTDLTALERGLQQFLAELDAVGGAAIRKTAGFGWSKTFVTAAAFGIVALEMARRRLQRAFPEVVALVTHEDLTWSWLPNDPGLPEDKEL